MSRSPSGSGPPSASRPRSGRSAAALAATTATVLAVAYMAALPSMHSGGDNAAYLSLGASMAYDGEYAETWTPGAPPHAKYPPAYPLALAAMMRAGAETWTAFKTLSILLTGLSAAFCFLWVRRLRGTGAAAAVALLYGLSPTALYGSSWVLADPLFAALTLAGLWLLTPNRAAAAPAAPQPSDAVPAAQPRPWTLAAGLALAVVAYFTRAAGLPLVVAAVLWLGAANRWKALAGFVAGFLALAALWLSRDPTTGSYGSEFWLVSPYDPSLGTVGAVDFVERIAENVWNYTTDYVATGLAGWGGAWAVAGGSALAALVCIGWVRQIRKGAGVAEFFFPLYAGLLVVWPAVWGGDRYALPLFPVMLHYSAGALAALARRFRVRPELALAAGAAAVAVPLSWSAYRNSVAAAFFREECAATSVPVACLSPQGTVVVAMAAWAGEFLPEEAVVFSRKPRVFHLYSGLPSVGFPFSRDERDFFSRSDSLNAKFVAFAPDGVTDIYVAPVLQRNGDRFCWLVSFNVGGRLAQLLQITEPRTLDPDSPPAESIAPCDPDASDEADAAAFADLSVVRSPNVPAVSRAKARQKP